MTETKELKVIDKRHQSFENLPISQQDSFFQTIERLASRPDIDCQKIKQIMDMQERVLDRNAKEAFNASMTKAQNKIDLIVTKEWNDQTKSHYANLKAILLQAKPIYTEEGFSLMFYEEDPPKENQKRICVDIMHRQGHTEKRHVDLTIQTTGMSGKTFMTQIHGEGSAFSYGRRYLTCMIFNIPTGDDDDAQAAGSQTNKSENFISKEQEEKLSKAFKETDMMEGAFLKALKVETLSELPASKFNFAMGICKTRKKI